MRDSRMRQAATAPPSAQPGCPRMTSGCPTAMQPEPAFNPLNRRAHGASSTTPHGSRVGTNVVCR